MVKQKLCQRGPSCHGIILIGSCDATSQLSCPTRSMPVCCHGRKTKIQCKKKLTCQSMNNSKSCTFVLRKQKVTLPILCTFALRKQRVTPPILFSLYLRSKQKGDNHWNVDSWWCALSVLYTHVTWVHVKHGSILKGLEVARVEIRREWIITQYIFIIRHRFYNLAIHWCIDIAISHKDTCVIHQFYSK
jgi:hypothetical protein